MNFFESKLNQGILVFSYCTSCNDVVWPASDYCNRCMGKVVWKNSDGIGKIIEFSKKNGDYFCLAEFEGKIRIIGRLRNNSRLPEIGKKVLMDSCKIKDKNYEFIMKLG